MSLRPRGNPIKNFFKKAKLVPNAFTVGYFNSDYTVSYYLNLSNKGLKI